MRTYRRGKERKGDGHSHHKAKPVCTENSILIDYVTESPKEVDAAGIIPCSDLPQTSNNIIQKGLAFAREQSGSVTVPGTRRASGSCPAGCMAKVGLWWWRQTMPHQLGGGSRCRNLPIRNSSFCPRLRNATIAELNCRRTLK